MIEGKRNEHQTLVAARVADFLNPETHWQRRLWTIGPFLGLRELLEAAEMRAEGVLSETAVSYLANELRDVVKRDPALTSPGRRRSLLLKCTEKLVAGSIEWRTLSELEAELRSGYLSRWAKTLELDSAVKSSERVARGIAAHMLASGFSPEYLHGWWTQNAQLEVGDRSLSEVLREAHSDQSENRDRLFKVLIPLHSGPRRVQNGEEIWLASDRVEAWLRQNCVDGARPGRQQGALLFEVSAHDQWGAVRAAAGQLDDVMARYAVGTRKRTVRPQDTAWVDGYKKPVTLSYRRRVEVRALEREEQLLLSSRESNRGVLVNTALHLLGPLQEGPASSAAASGWAAIEATLVLPGDRGNRAMAANRLAALVACSWPRAELTTLAYRYERLHGDELAIRIESSKTNRQAAGALLSAIRAGDELKFQGPSDRAALKRLRSIVGAPGKMLRDVEQHVTHAFRRLYRQRNLVLHGGKIDAVALEATLRVVAPLVGAGFDRISHAAFVDGVAPGDIAARAFRRLHSLDDVDPECDLVGLLD